jgi:beta-mannosidase
MSPTELNISSNMGKATEVMNKATDKKVISLNSTDRNEWTVFFGPQDENAPHTPQDLEMAQLESIMVSVPGNIEVDLEREGYIKDPTVGDNVFELRKYETYHWWYKRNFQKPEIPRNEKVELCFDGIDCIADIWLNGQLIASVENMLVEHHFDITRIMQENNTLYVHIKSTELEARNYVRNHLGIRKDQLGGSVSIRKAAHMFGWDIMPRLMSAGIWKDARIEIIKPDYFSSVYWVTKRVDIKTNSADLYVDWQFHTRLLNIDGLSLTFELERNGKYLYQKTIPVITTIARHIISNLGNIEFWWPKGFGESSLYNARLSLADPEGNILAVNEQRIGIRTAELVYTPINTVENPGDFHFRINGEKVFIKGTNWVPLDGLHSRDLSHLQNTIDMLVDLNCNMVRCWGGNVYESDDFYNLCDENGIMVWQDFSMGCTLYPQDESFKRKIKIEADKVIRRLRHHPSLILWAGNNENDVSLVWDDAQDHIDPNTDVISREVLPLAVREWDPERPYLPSSPFISSEVFKIHNRIVEEFSPERHLWGPRGYYKASYYTDQNARFVSEIGYHGCPHINSLEKMMTAENVYPWTNRKDIKYQLDGIKQNPINFEEIFTWNEEWQCKATNSHPNSDTYILRNNLMINQIYQVFGNVPVDLDDFVLASQIVQAEAMKYFIEIWRMDKGFRNGILWWNLRDGWPIISDAIVDYFGARKLAYDYIKKVQVDICVMIGDATTNGHPVVAVNDTREEKAIKLEIKDADSGKSILRQATIIDANGKQIIAYLPGQDEHKLWLIEYVLDNRILKNHYISFNPPLSFRQYKKWLPVIRE